MAGERGDGVGEEGRKGRDLAVPEVWRENAKEMLLLTAVFYILLIIQVSSKILMSKNVFGAFIMKFIQEIFILTPWITNDVITCDLYKFKTNFSQKLDRKERFEVFSF